MTKNSPKDSEKDEDTWHQFSNAGYSSASADFDNEEIGEQQNTEEEYSQLMVLLPLKQSVMTGLSSGLILMSIIFMTM